MTAHTLTIKLKYDDFVQITRSKTLPQAITNIEGFEVILADLLKDTDIGQKKYGYWESYCLLYIHQHC